MLGRLISTVFSLYIGYYTTVYYYGTERMCIEGFVYQYMLVDTSVLVSCRRVGM